MRIAILENFLQPQLPNTSSGRIMNYFYRRLNWIICLYCIVVTVISGNGEGGKSLLGGKVDGSAVSKANAFRAKRFHSVAQFESKNLNPTERSGTDTIVTSSLIHLVNKLHCLAPLIHNGLEFIPVISICTVL